QNESRAECYHRPNGRSFIQGGRIMTLSATKYNVGGVLLDRPFKIRRLGHFGYNTIKSEACQRFYQELLGFKMSDPRPGFGGFFRYGSDHHAFVMGDRKSAEER